MDAFQWAVKRLGFVFFLTLFSVLMPSGDSFADRGRHFDGTTRCRWSRTWHGPNSIWQPLTPYYVPRPADPCLYGGYGRSCYEDGYLTNGCGLAADGEGRYFNENAVEYESGSVVGYADPPTIAVGLERLGQIPNDLAISGAAAGAPGARPGR